MEPVDDSALLRQYCDHHSDDAFAAIVTRYINLVYSVALRQVANPDHAEEITQAVFIILAKKAVGLRHDKALSSWLFRTTHLVAKNFIRSEMRRHRREQEAYMQSTLEEPESGVWERITPLLDAAVAALKEKDRRAIVLRFYEGRSLSEVAAALGTSEEASKKRVSRALEKLQKFFDKRGVNSTAATIAETVSINAVQTAPATLAKSVTVVAFAKGAAASASTLTVVKMTLKTMVRLRMKLPFVVGTAVLLVVGVATIALSPNTSTFTPTVYSLLEKQPIVAIALFEKEMNPKLGPDLPATARKETFNLMLDGENYRLEFGGAMVGRFGDVYWQTTGPQLEIFDSRINSPDGDPSGLRAFNRVTRMGINFLITSCITTATPKNLVWENGHKNLTFDGNDGAKLSVEFNEENGLPVSAAVHDLSNGNHDCFITYRYDAGFFGGRLPIEISRYRAADERNMESVIRIKSLKFSQEHLPARSLDPLKLVNTGNPGYKLVFYSNNIPYLTDARGTARRVLTVEENAAELEKIRGNK